MVQEFKIQSWPPRLKGRFGPGVRYSSSLPLAPRHLSFKNALLVRQSLFYRLNAQIVYANPFALFS